MSLVLLIGVITAASAARFAAGLAPTRALFSKRVANQSECVFGGKSTASKRQLDEVAKSDNGNGAERTLVRAMKRW